MGRRQALGWLGAAVCSVALVVAGGLVLSSVAVHRYLQASSSAQQPGDSTDGGATPEPSELASVERAVTALSAMPGVATATSSIDTSVSPEPSMMLSSRTAPAPTRAPKTLSYDVSVIMNPDAGAAECADVVFALTRQLQNARVNLELSSPAGDGHAASVIDYRNAFDTPVPRSTVDSVSHAVAVATAVPGVKSVYVTVPYTWNLATGDLSVELTAGDAHQSAALDDALAHTAFAGLDWSKSAGRSNSPSVTSSPSRSQRPGADRSPVPTHSPAPTHTPRPSSTSKPTPTSTPSASSTPTPAESSR